MAKRWSSPPERWSMSRSRTCLSSTETLKHVTRSGPLSIQLTEALQSLLHVVHLRTGLDKLADVLHRALHCPGNLVDILRLHDSLQVIFQNLGEVVCASQ